MTWREFLLTSCAWIIALIAGVLSYVEASRAEPQSHRAFHMVLHDLRIHAVLNEKLKSEADQPHSELTAN